MKSPSSTSIHVAEDAMQAKFEKARLQYWESGDSIEGDRFELDLINFLSNAVDGDVIR